MIRLWLLLRLLLLSLDEGGDGDGEEEGEEEQAQQEEGEDAGESGEGEEEIRDPKAKIKALQSQVGHLAMKLDKKDAELKKRDRRIKELEDQARASGESESEDVRSARLESQFLRACIQRGDLDHETAWDLATARNFLDAVNPDGEGMDESIERLVEQYPWLVGNGNDEDGEEDRASRLPRTRHPSAPRPEQQRMANASQLKKRFPALRRGR
jgi:hypothetical protein